MNKLERLKEIRYVDAIALAVHALNETRATRAVMAIGECFAMRCNRICNRNIALERR